MRQILLRVEVLAVVVVAICLAVLSGGQKPTHAAQLDLAAGPGGPLTLSNDKEGAAILSLGGMRPGDSVTDTVTLGNTGTVDGDLSLSTSNLIDNLGAGGGALSGKLDLRVRDVTVSGSPVTVYNGKLDSVSPVALGTLAAGAFRVYEFHVSFPDAGPGAENAYQGSATTIQFDWSAVNNGPDTDPPDTTITSGPASPTASQNATFAFTADEAGSTFECSLDGAPFGDCASPVSYSGLADGAHSFGVRATDGSSNTDSTPDTASWTVDHTAPSVSLADPGSPLSGPVTLVPSADDGTGSGIATLIVQRSPSGAGTWTTTATNWNTSSVADGVYDLRARATDNAGNTATSALRTVTVDNGAPTAPKKFSGAKKNGHLVLSWKPATDSGGPVSAYLVYANSSLVKTLGSSARSVDMGRFKTSDARVFQVAAKDAAGNIGPKTRGLMIVPALAKLTVAKATQRLTARGLRVGKVSYAYSKFIASGRVIRAGGVVALRNAAVPLSVSRGRAPGRPTSASDEGDGTNDSTPSPSLGGTSPGEAAPGGESFTPTSVPPSGEPQSGDAGAGATGSEQTPGSADVVPSSFSPSDDSSPLRRTLGFALLGGAFLAAGAAALRAARLRPRVRSPKPVESLVFWDERLLHVVSNTVRRVTGRL
jgi:Big-like domain-containing protein